MDDKDRFSDEELRRIGRNIATMMALPGDDEFLDRLHRGEATKEELAE